MVNGQGATPFFKLAWLTGAGLILLALTTGLVFAQPPTAARAESQSDATMTHEQMHQMMDVVHGEGASERMHQAMGEGSERMMDQCAAMMNMMMMMMNMMGPMRGMMSGEGMPGMMQAPGSGAMSDMMRGMMGR